MYKGFGLEDLSGGNIYIIIIIIIIKTSRLCDGKPPAEQLGFSNLTNPVLSEPGTPTHLDTAYRWRK